MSNRKQKVVLNGQTSSWAIITAGDLQGSVNNLVFHWKMNFNPDPSNQT